MNKDQEQNPQLVQQVDDLRIHAAMQRQRLSTSLKVSLCQTVSDQLNDQHYIQWNAKNSLPVRVNNGIIVFV